MKPRIDTPIIACAVYVVLHFSAHFSASIFEVSPGVSIWYAPCGLALALLTLLGPAYAPVVFATNCLASLAYAGDSNLLSVLVLPALITGNYATTAWLVRKLNGPLLLPGSRRNTTTFILATIVSPIPMALIGATSIVLMDRTDASAFASSFFNWWVGDVSGLLTVVPVAMVFGAPYILRNKEQTSERPRFNLLKDHLILVRFFILIVSLALVFALEPLKQYNAFYLCFLPLIWICTRHGLPGATLATLAVTMGGLIGMHLLGSSAYLITNFLLFELAAAAMGLGLGAAVSQRNKAESELAESEARLERVINGAQLGLWDWDWPNGRISYSHRDAEMLGYTLPEIENSVDAREQLIHPGDRERVRAAILSHIQAETPLYEAEYRLRTKDHHWRWVLSRGSVVARDAQNKPLRFSGTHIDITARKRAEAETRRLLQVIEASTDFTATTDISGGFLFANAAFLRLLETEQQALLGRSLIDQLPGWAARTVQMEAIPYALSKGAWHGEIAVQNRKGTEIPVSLVLLAHHDEESESVTLSFVMRDISRQRQAEAERIESERKLLQMQKLESLGVLAGGIAHDFNNLLTVVLGNASLARFDLPKESAIHNQLSQIEGAAMNAAQLCQQMLAYAGRSPLAFAPVDPSRMIEDTAHLLQATIGKKHVLSLDLARPSALVNADLTQLRQIITNLTLNATQAIGDREGRITLRTSVRFLDALQLDKEFGERTLPPGRYLLIELDDTGCGMTPDVLSRIFEPFYTTKFPGHGLGLPAVQGIVKAHKGTIHVVSELGKGSSFRLLFPALETLTVPTQTPQAPLLQESDAQGEGYVLVVDDEDGVRSVVSRTVGSLGFTPIEAVDGFQAVEIFKDRHREIRFTILDLTMPRMGGDETFKALQAINPEVPTILMSGFSEVLSLERFETNKPAAFIAKPFDHRALKSCLHQIEKLKSAV